jgi:DNA-binding response OmpR family regulator
LSENSFTYEILLIDDDYSSSSALMVWLEQQGAYHVRWESSAEKALEVIFQNDWHCILLDINMPGMNGLELLRTLRELGSESQVLLVSVRSSESDILKGLDLGADDYLVKPYSLKELKARVDARLRRSKHPGTSSIICGNTSLCEKTSQLMVGERSVLLNKKEYRIMKLFLKHPELVFSRQQLLDLVWGIGFFGTGRTVDNYIVALRKTLEENNSNLVIDTVRGLGYRLLERS